MQQALLIVDIQNDYFKGGKMELVNREKVCANAVKIAEAFRTRELPVTACSILHGKRTPLFSFREHLGLISIRSFTCHQGQ